MIFLAAPEYSPDKASVQLIHEFRYPVYFVAFGRLGKLVGCLVLPIPGLKILERMGGAGLFFDHHVVYSSIVVSDGVVDPRMARMLAFGFCQVCQSYYLVENQG